MKYTILIQDKNAPMSPPTVWGIFSDLKEASIEAEKIRKEFSDLPRTNPSILVRQIGGTRK